MTKNIIKLIIVAISMFLFTFVFSNINTVSAAGGQTCTVGAYGITTCANTGIIFQDDNPGQIGAFDVIAIGAAFNAGLVLILNGKYIKNKLKK
ncbi:MAG: hypothetical protein ABI721_00390 [Candidatus Dojkabacteria bacterium]